MGIYLEKMLALDILTLQQETIDLLESSKDFLSKINNTENCLQQITQQQELVKKLELRMTVVAPMKAGKSTIINAIVGQELVPSHSFAMTTLPTEIVINNQLTEPKLQIPNQTVEILTGLTKQITQKIEQQGIDWAYKQTEEYLHLKDLVTKLAQGMPINSQVIGYSEIQNYLEKVNHIIRLATKLIPKYDWNISHLPRIETPCQSFSSLQQSKLIIVDTPGPNEAGDNHKLAETVITQIQNSSVVLFILDYTNLHTKAEEDVKKEVQKIIELRGKDNLFVLVNKIDARKDEKSLNSEQVKSFVRSEFGIENIFEISAINAFNANSFLQCSINTQEFGKKIYKNRWERMQNILTENDLQQDAEQMWEESGFSSFLKDVIYKLTVGSTHECMRTAIKTARSCLLR